MRGSGHCPAPYVVQGLLPLKGEGKIGLNRFYKILQYPQPFLLTLLRMELCGKEVLLPDAGDEGFAIGSEGGDPLCLFWNDILGVHKIEEIATLYALEHGNLVLLLNRIPTHMGNLMLRIGPEFYHFSSDQIYSFVGSKLFTFREK